MSIRKLKPITPGQRFRVVNGIDAITTEKPERARLAPIESSGGRNSQGKMTMRYTGGGHKRRYRVIDFKRNKDGIPATVKSIEYDPNRTAFIALLNYADGEKRYIIAPNGLAVGSTVLSGPGSPPDVGNCLLLKEVPLGSPIHAIELEPGRGAAIARSAGTNGVLMGREDRYATVKMPSGEVRKILLTCKVTMGTTSNPDHAL